MYVQRFTIIISGSGTILLSNAIIPITYIAPPPSSSSSSSAAEEEDAQESQQILSLYRQSPSLNRDFISCNWRRRSPTLVFCCCSWLVATRVMDRGCWAWKLDKTKTVTIWLCLHLNAQYPHVIVRPGLTWIGSPQVFLFFTVRWVRGGPSSVGMVRGAIISFFFKYWLILIR